MRNKKRRVTLLTTSFLLLLSGCASSGLDGSVFSPLTVWSASSVDRISRTDASVDTRQKKMKITMAKNEREGGQLMFRSTSDINAYNVTVTDLVSSDHRYLIPKEEISIFNAKYASSVGINQKYNNPSLPTGAIIPDALLPFDTAVEYGENTLPKDENQSVYIEVNAGKNVMAGTYSGQIKLVADAYAHYIPLEVKVINYVIPDEPTTMNYFARWGTEHFNSAELDCGEEITTAYYETMLGYRMSSTLPFEGEGGPDRYVELLRQYYHAPGFSAYKFFYEATYSYYNDMAIPYNVPLCQEYLRKIIVASLEDNVNYLDKAFFYFSTFVDEPDTNASVSWDDVYQIATTVKKMLTDLAAELDASLAKSSNYSFYISKVRQTLIDIPNIIPGGYSIATLEKHGADDISACTELSRFDSKEVRDSYNRDGGQQKWWYTCIVPQYPYPNLLANSYLTSPRLITWMQQYYDIDGFLIWDALNYSDGDNDSMPIVNTYGDLSQSMTAICDGKIFYPGAPYGIKGPVPSLRAVSYRDGMEDGEIINAIYKRYEEFGLDAAEAVSEIMKKEFNGTITNGSASDFTSARESLMEVYENIFSSTALLYDGSTQGKTANDMDVSFILPNHEAKAYVDGEPLEIGEDGLYHYSLNANKNPSVDFEVKVGNLSTVYTKRITGVETSLSDFENDSLDNWSTDRLGSLSISAEAHTSGNKSMAITLQGYDYTGYEPSFALDAKAFGNTSSLSELSFSFYVPNEVADSYKMTVSASYGTSVISNVSVGSVILKQGWNEVRLSIQESVRSLENLKEFRFYLPNMLDDAGAGVSRTFYLDDCAYVSIIDYGGSQADDLGEVVTSKNEDAVIKGDKKSLILEEDDSNVEVEENGEKYLMLGDFETYNQAAQIRYENSFGTLSLVSDPQFVTHGEKALKMENIGRGEALKKRDPVMTFFTGSDYFQKGDFSDCDYLEADFYNAMEYSIPLRFSNTNAYFAGASTVLSFTLTPGMNHIQIDLSAFSTRKFTRLCFIFDRAENYDENRVVYFDNFRAHYAKEAA